jgi:hypothetical protein
MLDFPDKAGFNQSGAPFSTQPAHCRISQIVRQQTDAHVDERRGLALVETAL